MSCSHLNSHYRYYFKLKMFKRCFGYFIPIALYGPQIITETSRSVRLNDFQFFRCWTAHGCDYRTTRTEFGGRRSGWGTGIYYVEYGDEVARRRELKENLRRNTWLRRQWSSSMGALEKKSCGSVCVVGQELKLLRWGNGWWRLMIFWNKKCCSEEKRRTL